MDGGAVLPFPAWALGDPVAGFVVGTVVAVGSAELSRVRLVHGRHALAEWPARFGRWLAEGMVFPHTVLADGLEAAPQALIDLIDGRHTGTVTVRLG